jgi:hypothetical protein
MKDKRRKFSENEKLQLFAEVEAMCPNCPNVLMYVKNGKRHKEFEIAHIYPLNPKPDEKELLKDEERLHEDPNHLDNLICLCVSCHTKFDKPRTVSEYRDLVAKKKVLIKRFKERETWNNTKLENEIFQIMEFLSGSDIDIPMTDELSYDPKTIEEKTDESIDFITKRSIHRNVQDYYHLIREKFAEIDTLSPLSTETISSQIKSYYLTLRKQNLDSSQQIIFDSMVEWLNKMTNQTSREACEILISYFIQNCEVFE